MYVQNWSPHRILKIMTPEEAYTSVKPEVSHFYIHMPKDRRSKLEPSSKKGVFVGYSESSKAYRIYILGQKQIEIRRDVSFEEDVALKRSKGSYMEIDNEEQETPQDMDIDHSPEVQRDYTEPKEAIDPVEPLERTDGLRYIAIGRKRLLWARQTMQDAKKYAALEAHSKKAKDHTIFQAMWH
ncbi:uncharacterized protein LOC131046356 [Cryptomeria japonica]|uniref:uncharacterized protein LOC131046356 n=1 Tax=Cryptomeria japonica TaxID=3369 RepID=UPI0025AD1638|nr:uncharacterized protein LOC131046356 [Cryptomeria japonica]